MTLNKLIDKYIEIQKKGYETIVISEVVNDLRQVKSIGKPTNKSIYFKEEELNGNNSEDN